MATPTNPLGPTIRTIPGIGTFAAPAPAGGPVGGITWAGSIPTPGYVSPFDASGNLKDSANSWGTPENAAARRYRQTGRLGATQGGINRSYGGIGRGGGRRIGGQGGTPLSAATGRGLADYYNMNSPNYRGAYDRLQARARAQQDWLQDSGVTTSPQITKSNLNTTSVQSPGLIFNPGLNAHVPPWAQPQYPRIPFRAKGGDTKAIQPYIVNEEGVEAYQPKGGKPMLIPGPMQMFIPPKDGKIIPHDKTMKMAKEGKVMPPIPRMGGGHVMGVNPPQYRANGGNVRGVPYAAGFMGPSLGGGGAPPWVKWAQTGGQWLGPAPQQQAQQQAAPQPRMSRYDELFQMGLNAGIDMSRAPSSLSGLQRYLSMGRRANLGAQQAALETRRVAQEREEGRVADEAWRQRQFPGQLVVNPDGTRDIVLGGRRVGSSSNTPRTGPGMFANAAGEMLPWSVPQGSWQTTWSQDAILNEARGRTRRASTGEPISYAQYSIIDEFIP